MESDQKASKKMSKLNLKQVGLKATGPRLRILEILSQDNNKHLSAEDIYNILRENGHDMSLATVYRALAQFQAVGLIIRHNFDGDHGIFELSDAEHHDHLVCIECNMVLEFLDKAIENRQEHVAKAHGFEITGHSLYLFGICARCRKE